MKKIIVIAALVLLFPVVGIVGIGIYGYTIIRNIDNSMQTLEQSFDKKIELLQRQIALLQEEIRNVTGENASVALSLQEIQNRQVVREKSQDELVTAAVAKTTPAVVSIVISKNIPLLEVAYVNPFGDDPFFKDSGIRVPVYRQKGVERNKVGAGTGFIIHEGGYILTNKHVVSDTQATYMVLLSNGKQEQATVIYKDGTHDIAIIKINGTGYSTAKLGNSSSIKLGQTVVAIGNALGEYNNSVSVGIISGLNRNIEASDNGRPVQLTNVIQTDAAINPGNSGGPLITIGGEVIGVNVATVIGSNDISFSIPIDVVKEIIRKVLP